MIIRKVWKQGNSIAITLPKWFASEGDQVELIKDDQGSIIVKKLKDSTCCACKGQIILED